MSVMKDSMFLSITRIMKALVQLVITMILSRIFIESEYGTYKQLMLIFNIFITILPLGIPVTVSYYYKNFNKEEKDKLFSSTVLISLVLAGISFLVITLFKDIVVVVLNNGDLREYLTLISIYVAVNILFSFMENLYISSNNAKILSVINVIYLIIYGTVIAYSAYNTQSIGLVISLMLLLESIRFVILFVYILRKNKYKFIIEKKFIRTQFKDSIPLGLNVIVQTLNLYIDSMFISYLFSASDYAMYSIASTPIPFISIVTVSLATVALPNLSRLYNTNKDVNGMLKLWAEITVVGAVIIYPVFWILMFFSEGYTIFIYSEKYLNSIPIYSVYLLRLILSVTVFGNILIVLNKKKYILRNMIIGIVINCILNLILINHIGMVGAAVATIITQVVLIYLQLSKIGSTVNKPIKELMPYKNLIKIIMIPAPIAIIFLFISRVLDLGQVLNFFVYGTLIYIVTFIAFILSKIILLDDIMKFIKFRQGGKNEK